jgi:hypothetical protein
MTDKAKVISKLLVLDDDVVHQEQLRAFFEDNNLVALKAVATNVLGILKSNVDMGAIMLHEHYGGPGKGLAVARQIHRARPELPIFLRRDDRTDLGDFAEKDAKLFSAAYSIERIDKLREAIDHAIFNRVYPTALVRGITDLTSIALLSQFRDVTIEHEAPCLVRDRVIYGELFSLIPLESNWCRGYMMLQTAEQPLVDFVKQHKTHAEVEQVGFRDINNVLGEATNLIWGSFKNRFISHEAAAGFLTQVPIIVNHGHRYISFGSEDPQLCVRYTLQDTLSPDGPSLHIYQRFIFNLSWTPDNFSENEVSVDELFDSGELEMF